MKSKVLLITLLSAGCASLGHLNTPSGKPEVTVRATKHKAMEACAAWFNGHGYQIDKQTDFSLVGTRNNGATIFSTDDIIKRRAYTFLSSDSGITIFGSGAAVFRISQGGEHEYPDNDQNEYELIQSDLNDIAGSLH